MDRELFPEGLEWMVEFGPFKSEHEAEGYWDRPTGPPLLPDFKDRDVWMPADRREWEPEFDGAYFDWNVNIFDFSRFGYGLGSYLAGYHSGNNAAKIVPPPFVHYAVYRRIDTEDRINQTIQSVKIVAWDPWSASVADRRHMSVWSEGLDALPDLLELVEMASRRIEDLLACDGDVLANTIDRLWYEGWESEEQMLIRGLRDNLADVHLIERWKARAVICKMRPGSDERVLAEQLLARPWVGSAFSLFASVGATLGIDVREALVEAGPPVWITEYDDYDDGKLTYPDLDRWTGEPLTE